MLKGFSMKESTKIKLQAAMDICAVKDDFELKDNSLWISIKVFPDEKTQIPRLTVMAESKDVTKVLCHRYVDSEGLICQSDNLSKYVHDACKQEREKVLDEVVEKLDIILHKHCSSYRFITNELIEKLREVSK